ncbi:ATP-dependent RNA helicase DbpA [Thalassolituus oleivorans]|jgi:ATP-independent RNA helicase DbpA|uniref:ATP-dependent RNA helicase DbpA n=1 Tax=Thalassolituus oleivorans TaxID=187493 RepID=UPI00042DD8E3|nr:ATP-dependent RNA helicase DbpA [Thalassolituus oleivorans]PCI46666.1 MAG: ATP-dependent RNA helicase DbpA [Oceanospirillales bacterium]PHQ87332.1 MAG: ATP-dependent RNA helicase DbpA [Thalassobium sp.]AHK16219.1 RNA helicase [Thalassolituus oleivorans R6-15]APR67564.1 ATP-dependent RNA helicase [Thalassolituus oleivorans]MBQ0727914.1 ATP-dependent RNA helicase DbpA [Thalassolituus oleivorans]
MTASTFASLGLPQEQLDNLQQMGYEQMTEIQQQALPAALEGKDVLAQARTGSGKTAAFGIALLSRINPRFFGAQTLIMCPTRELATQVATEIRKLARFQQNIKVVTLCGGMPIGPQIGSLEHGAHIVVGTPGRIKDHLRKQTLDISQINTLVLDEADRMLDMGFAADIDSIVQETPHNRQTLLFSATYPENIEALSRQYQNNPVSIRVESLHTAHTIQQQFIECDRDDRLGALERALAHFGIQQAVIFCNTKQTTHEVCTHLRDLGYSALGLHGDLEQKDRDRVLVRFRQGSLAILVATDVAARGLDVDDLPAVINYELPRDAEVYVHRIGRTGRAGKEGLALSLTTNKEGYKRDAIAEQIGQKVNSMNADDLSTVPADIERPEWITLALAAGRRHKMRPGDVLGALTKNGGITGAEVGKIDVLEQVTYVAVKRNACNAALQHLENTPIKGKNVRSRKA